MFSMLVTVSRRSELSRRGCLDSLRRVAASGGNHGLAVARSVLIEDQAMANAAKSLWSEFDIAADLSGAAAVAALLEGLVSVKPGEKVCRPSAARDCHSSQTINACSVGL